MPSNRLAAETSLYLRQHARNPVDWFPWGPEALAAARERDKPIFLSVGYSACHWCHVMERECFEVDKIADVMNAGFINIKVDREERPDLDQIYMNAHHALNRGEGGGWPLSVFLTPEGEPFYAGTYYPPDDRYMPQRPSFPRLLNAISEAWAGRRDELAGVGKNVATFLREHGETSTVGGSVPGVELVGHAVRGLRRAYDPANGGFGTAPKFPHAVDLRLIMRATRRELSPGALAMATHTLDRMACGGMYDQVGGGFHRYSVDAEWLVPHFEKMLYDNALLTPAYVDAFLVTGDDFYRRIAIETLDYIVREMTSPGGGFYSTQDADSEGVEGKFFVWDANELEAVVGANHAEFARRAFGVTDAGNFESHSILFRPKNDVDEAARQSLTVEQFRATLDEVKQKLYAARSGRVWPGRDEKILTAWNGLAIDALADAGARLGLNRFTEAAARAANFVLTNLRGADGRLFRTCGDGQPAKLAGYLEDYAYLASGLVTLYEACFEPNYSRAAQELCDVALAHFADGAGGFFATADDGEQLVVRPRESGDNATPAPGSVLTLTLLRLAALTGRDDFRAAADRALAAGSGTMAESPMAAAQLLCALDFRHGTVTEYAVLGDPGSDEYQEVLNLVRAHYEPNRVVASGDPAACELLAGKVAVGGAATLYRCRDFACAAPAVGVDAARELLGAAR